MEKSSLLAGQLYFLFRHTLYIILKFIFGFFSTGLAA
jgi:hypothetical protein